MDCLLQVYDEERVKFKIGGEEITFTVWECMMLYE